MCCSVQLDAVSCKPVMITGRFGIANLEEEEMVMVVVTLVVVIVIVMVVIVVVVVITGVVIP